MDCQPKKRDILEIFARQLIERKGGKEEEIPGLVEGMDREIDRALVEALPDEGIEAINQLDDNAPESELEAIFRRSGVNETMIIKDTMIKFGSEYLGGLR